MSWDPLEVYRQAQASSEATAGFYNDNVRVDTDSGPVLARVPIDGAAAMDLTIWPEHEVLEAIAPYVSRAPRLRHVSRCPRFQVHEFVPGKLLDHIAPRDTPVPEHVPADVVALFAELVRVPERVLPVTPRDWPDDGDTAAFASRLSDVTASVWAAHRDDFTGVFDRLGVPADPLVPALAGWPTLSSRPFRLVHADVHRKNMIVTEGSTVFLDWELALWGDPLYELAVHFHKMGYRSDEREAVLRGWLAAVPAECSTGWEGDLDAYLTHERIKSVVVDTVRYAKLLAGGDQPAEQERSLVERLAGKANAARPYWGREPDMTAGTVEAALRDQP